MKGLSLNAQKYEFSLYAYCDHGIAEIGGNLGETTLIPNQVSVNSREAKKIGEWFLALAKELENNGLRT